MATFDNVWSWLQNNMKSGQLVKNWSVYHGYLGRTMTVLDVRSDYIKVDPPKAKNIQVVPREDFKKLWEDWPAYKSRELPRSAFLEKSRFITYVISILHYYEQEVVDNA